MQIGELSGKLSEEFKNNYSQIPWNAIKATRNIVAHEYGKIDIETVWETATTDIIELKIFCINIIG